MNNNTKIAICMSGHIRTLLYTFEKNFDLIKRMNPNSTFEIHCAFWEKEYGRNTTINDPWHYAVNVDDCDFDSVSLTNELLELSNQSHVNVKLYDIGAQRKYTDFVAPLHPRMSGLLSQYFLIQESFNLAKSSNANFYVRIRPDVIVQSFPDLSIVDSDLIMSKLIWYNFLAPSRQLENETVWVARASVAQKAFSIFDAVIDGNLLHGIEHYGESITGKHFSNILVKKDHFNFQYRVAR